MRILCLFIPHLPLQVEERDIGTLKDKLVIIGGLPHERKMVYDASLQAMGCGVKIGMPLRHAYSLCPEAHFIPNDGKKYGLAFEGVLDVLGGFSPLVEKQGLGLAFIDASGLGNYYKGEDNLARQLLSGVRSGCSLAASAGMADNKFVARTAAALARPGEFTLVPQGDGKDFLAPLPVDVLPCLEKLREQLHLLGIKTVGEAANLGSEALTAQFGEEGNLLYQLACGIDESPLLRQQRPDQLEQDLSFDPPVDTLDDLLNCIGESVDGLSARLKERWQLCQRIELFLRFDDGNSEKEGMDLKVPTRSRKTLLSLLRLRLEQASFESPVSGVSITLSRLCQDGKQLYLPVGIAGERQQIAAAAREIRGRLGGNMIKRPVILDQEALLPEQRFVLRDLEI